MKKLFTNIFVFLILGVSCAQVMESNIISYYAVNNSLDGQPMIEQMNKLRFFPVFAMHEKIDTVTVTIYHGPKIYTRDAVSYNNKKYWEVLLPSFDLGDAIQRIEVEVKFGLKRKFTKKYEIEANLIEDELNAALNSILDSVKKIKENECYKKILEISNEISKKETTELVNSKSLLNLKKNMKELEKYHNKRTIFLGKKDVKNSNSIARIFNDKNKFIYTDSTNITFSINKSLIYTVLDSLSRNEEFIAGFETKAKKKLNNLNLDSTSFLIKKITKSLLIQ